MITSLLFQDHAAAPVVLCKANTRTEAKHAAACYAARVAFMRTLYGYQPCKGLIDGYIHKIDTDGAIVVAEIGFVAYGYSYGMFELPIHVFKIRGQSVSSSVEVRKWLHRSVVLKIASHYKLEGFMLSKVAEVSIADGEEGMELPCELNVEVEA